MNMKKTNYIGIMLGILVLAIASSCRTEPLVSDRMSNTVWHDSEHNERLIFGDRIDDGFIMQMLDDCSYTAHRFDYKLEGTHIEVYRHQEDGTKLTMRGTIDGQWMRLSATGMSYNYVKETH